MHHPVPPHRSRTAIFCRPKGQVRCFAARATQLELEVLLGESHGG